MSRAEPRVREAGQPDLPFLWEMLGEVLAWAPDRPATLEELLADPRLSRYLDGWGRAGDVALVAEDGEGRPLGAAWYRLFSAQAPGHGFVAEDVPEVAIAVRHETQGQGVGTVLLSHLIGRAQREGRPALSLSADSSGCPRRLYERLGFRVCGRHASEDLVLMRLDLI